MLQNPESARLQEARDRNIPWKKWGPYLSERQWGTVREDYSPHGNAWEFFPHEHARSRVYRWMASLESATGISRFVLPSRYGTAGMPS